MQLDQHVHGISSDEDVGAYTSYVSYVLLDEDDTANIQCTFH